MRWTAVLAVALASCATYEQIQPEINAARDAWSDCIAKAVRRLDDGKTDPISMAYGISPQCAVQYRNLTEQMLRPMNTERSIAAMRETMRTNETKLITSLIINVRAAAKN